MEFARRRLKVLKFLTFIGSLATARIWNPFHALVDFIDCRFDDSLRSASVKDVFNYISRVIGTAPDILISPFGTFVWCALCRVFEVLKEPFSDRVDSIVLCH